MTTAVLIVLINHFVIVGVIMKSETVVTVAS